jgi:hypothetical protein
MQFRNSVLGAGTINLISFGNNINATVELIGCTLNMFGTGRLGTTAYGNVLLKNCTINCLATTGIVEVFNRPSRWVFDNCDFSGSATSAAIVNWNDPYSGSVVLRNCKLPTSWIPSTGTVTAGSSLHITKSAAGTISAAIPGITYFESAYGTAQTSLTRYRTGGATDGVQINPYSLEMTTNASAFETFNALEINLGSRWASPKASISGATAQGIYTSYRDTPLTAPTALTIDTTSTWTGTGVDTKQKIDHMLSNGDTLTVYVASAVTLENDEFWIEVTEPDQIAGWVTVKAFLAKPSTTVYVDPKLGVI